MKFDKSKVYTVLNADEVKIGSKGFFGDYISGLKNNMEDGKIFTVRKIWGENYFTRFQAEDGTNYALFYLVEEPEEEKYRPYENTDEMVEDFKERFNTNGSSYAEPLIWVKRKGDVVEQQLITGFYEKNVFVEDYAKPLKELFEDFTYLDGSPCGMKI